MSRVELGGFTTVTSTLKSGRCPHTFGYMLFISSNPDGRDDALHLKNDGVLKC